jgi:NAD(P)H-dependent FMN reductase
MSVLDPLRVFLVCGSVRKQSRTRLLTEVIGNALAAGGAEAVHWDLRDSPLPIADPEYHHDPSQHPDALVRRYVDLAANSHAFILSSPIYHNSCSGVLKNALDHLTVSHFLYKPVGLASHGGNRSSQAVDHLRIIVRGLLGVAVPTQVCTADNDYAERSTGDTELGSEMITDRIHRLAFEVITFSHALRQVRRG